MAAAGLGNAMSDAVGIASGSAIEGAAERAGMSAPSMSAAAAAQPITGAVNYAAQVRMIVTVTVAKLNVDVHGFQTEDTPIID